MLFGHTLLMVVGAIGVVGALGFLALASRRETVLARVLAMFGAVIFGAAGVGAYGTYKLASHVVIVTGGDGNAVGTRYLLWGSTEVSVGGKSYHVSSTRGYAASSDHTWIINGTASPLTIERISYAVSPTMASAGAPMDLAADSSLDYPDSIDYLGPDDHPPSEIRDEVNVTGRAWLRW